MVIHRALFFLGVSLLIIIPAVTFKVIWLLKSEKTTGVFYLHGRGNALDQIRVTSSYVYFKHEKDTIWFTDLGNLPLKEGEAVSVVYQKANPADAKVNSFICIWGTVAFYCGVPLLILLVTAIHPGVIPYNCRVRVGKRIPFITIVKFEKPVE